MKFLPTYYQKLIYKCNENSWINLATRYCINVEYLLVGKENSFVNIGIKTYFSFIFVKFQISSSVKSLQVYPAFPNDTYTIHYKTAFDEDLSRLIGSIYVITEI